eukprot:s3976_g2.t1
MWTIPFKEIKLGAENYMSSQSRHAKRCHTYWLKWSKAVDKNLELSDEYGTGSQAGAKMFEGFGLVSMSTPGLLSALITPAIGLVSILTWVQMRHVAQKWKAQQKAAMKILDTVADNTRARPRWTVRSADLQNFRNQDLESEEVSNDDMCTATFQDDEAVRESLGDVEMTRSATMLKPDHPKVDGATLVGIVFQRLWAALITSRHYGTASTAGRPGFKNRAELPAPTEPKRKLRLGA